MAKLAFLSLFVASFLASFTAASETSPRPLRQTELLALVAGNALPENIVNEIRSRGVAFRMDDSFRGQLTTAGATPSILAALDAAKAPAKVPAEDKPDPALLQHIAAAGKLMKDKHFDEAADELTATLKGNFEKFEIGFVMGELLRRQDRCAEAAAVYAEVLRQNPDFPEAHTKLSFVLYCSGDGEDALREAKAALLLAPRNAEAHKNAGLALHLLGKPDAALAEYQEALRIKPDYDAVRYDIALVLYSKRDLDGAIAEYKKAIALNPDLVDARYNLAIILNEQGQLDAALQQYREAKRRAPGRFDIRMNLGNVLFAKGMYPEAMSEYRELTAMYPDTTMALNALAATLYATRDFQGAEKEYRKAAAVDPTDPKTFLGLGLVYEYQNKPNLGAALEQYRRAKELDANSPEASRDVGRVLLSQRKVSEALKELQEAVTLGPSSADTHDLYAQALMLSGDANAAITEFKESLGLDPKQVSVMLELAAALEKKGDWAAALNEYHQAAIAADIAAAPRQPGVGYRTYDAAHQYKEAQERFNQQLAALRKAGKSAEAARLETSIRNQQSAANAAQTLDSLMLSASQAFDERRFDDSERDYKKALAIAEKLQRHDIRTVTALNRLGQLAVFRHDSPGGSSLRAPTKSRGRSLWAEQRRNGRVAQIPGHERHDYERLCGRREVSEPRPRSQQETLWGKQCTLYGSASYFWRHVCLCGSL